MIELKYFERSDFKQLINWIDSPAFLLQWGGPGFNYPLNDTQLEKYMENANHANSEALIYKVVDQETGNVIGHISLGRIDRKNESARVGKVLIGDKNTRGKGIGQQMIKEILKIAFEELHLHRVSLGVFDFNDSAIDCYEKAGFVKEGLHRDASKNGDEYWSLWEMSILENEWLEIKNV
ncbi:GNAT family N-acetyltransferase [Pradoshia sp. D12]|uniref:GNAT family N-acetyltransferase n=1 Tax=Bacillaceae TaxID=186817 RepID=UPI00080AEC84|nr:MULTISPECIES: GNAT family protein [Bacillaceae]OCA90082.1 aminoglycoside adenylyltransferase [Bacillus sp. FJAT-27986]QFK70511.1 GNAT family N-acetyltransferase [Pradoshia sp. D12]TPF72306.1 GNAT family N-acetyltransferase [Bacillus sp. D12]